MMTSILLSAFLPQQLSIIRGVVAQPRPFWAIAHMVNSIKEVNYYLERGANGLETDITFAENGTAMSAYHGYPCDCFRHCVEQEEIGKFLQYIRDVSTPGKYLTFGDLSSWS